MNVDELVAHRGEWLRGEGPESDVVISVERSNHTFTLSNRNNSIGFLSKSV